MDLYPPTVEGRHRSTVFTVNFKHISHLVLVFLLLILSMYLIPMFDMSHFSYLQIKMTFSFIVYSFSEKISMKRNPLFTSFFKFLQLIYLLINNLNSYLLIRAIDATCNKINSKIKISFLNLYILKFKRLDISGT